MDSAGAMLGPLLAFGILFVAPARFDAVFVVSTLFAVLGLAVLILNVEGKPQRAQRVERDKAAPSFRAALGLIAAPRFAPLLIAAGLLSVASVSDAMIYVGLQRNIDFDPAVFPLLYVMTAIVFMGLAIPFGQLADRIGKVPVLLGGQALLFVTYGVLMMTSVGTGALVLCLLALGGYFAATEGVLTALAGAVRRRPVQPDPERQGLRGRRRKGEATFRGPRLRARLLRRRAWHLHGRRPFGRRLHGQDLRRELPDPAHDRPDGPALAGAGVGRRPLWGDDGIRRGRLLPRQLDRLLDPDDDP
jgi:hypothetical protein